MELKPTALPLGLSFIICKMTVDLIVRLLMLHLEELSGLSWWPHVLSLLLTVFRGYEDEWQLKSEIERVVSQV